MKLRLTKSAYDGMIAHGRREKPIEACGYLGGKDDVILKHYPMVNIDKSPVHYSFDPAEQFQVTRQAREEGYEIMANYHSHPESAAWPSKEDVRLAFDPDIFYFIVSMENDNPYIKAFWIVDEEITEIDLEVTKES